MKDHEFGSKSKKHPASEHFAVRWCFLVVITSFLLSACGSYNIKETGISREQAVSIAKSASEKDQENYTYVDREDWVRKNRCWVVELTDKSGDRGRAYKIDSTGQIIGAKVIDQNPNDDDYWPDSQTASNSKKSATGDRQHSDTKTPSAFPPPNGKGMVLIYRTPGLMGMAMKPYVWVNGIKFDKPLSRGGYYIYEAAPGPINVEFAWHDHYAGVGENILIGVTTGLVGIAVENAVGHKKNGIILNVLPNHTYYILMDGHRLTQVAKEEGEADVARCHSLTPR